MAAYLTVLFLLTLLQHVPQMVVGQGPIAATASVNTLVWERRINASLMLLQTKECKFFISNVNCTQLRRRSRQDMNVYIAGQENHRAGKLSAVLPDKFKLLPTSYDAVVVIDPYPQESLGHPILVFFIDTSSTLTNCVRNQRSTYTRDPVTGNGECVTITQKTRRCTNRLHDRKRKRRCDINFVPTVFLSKGKDKTPILQCVSYLAGFGQCAFRMNQRPVSDKCRNSKRCAITPNPVRQQHCSQICDYAVLLAGGWNALTTTTKAEDNIKSIWSHLRQNGFIHKNIMVFVGNRYYVETDGNPHTKDSIPTENEFKIRSQIKNLCGSNCVDSLVIYLNKPTKSNGGMLIWDENNDGYAEESERYDAKELIDDLRDCRAKQVTVIADQSFSGALLERFRSAKRHPSRGSLKNIVFIASADASSYPVYGSFTKNWVKSSYPTGTNPRCLREVIQDMSVVRTDDYKVNYERGSPGLLDRTIYGGLCNKDLQTARRNDMACQFRSRHHRKNLNRG